MNVHNVRELFRELESAPLEQLGKNDIDSLGKTLVRFIDKARKAEIDFRIKSFEKTVPDQYSTFFKKESKWVKRPAASASIAAKEAYLERLKDVWQKTERKIEDHRAVLKSIRQADASDGLELLRKMPAAQKKDLSLLANLSKPKSDGKSAAFNLSAADKNNLAWIEALKESRTRTILD